MAASLRGISPALRAYLRDNRMPEMYEVGRSRVGQGSTGRLLLPTL